MHSYPPYLILVDFFILKVARQIVVEFAPLRIATILFFHGGSTTGEVLVFVVYLVEALLAMRRVLALGPLSQASRAPTASRCAAATACTTSAAAASSSASSAASTLPLHRRLSASFHGWLALALVAAAAAAATAYPALLGRGGHDDHARRSLSLPISEALLLLGNTLFLPRPSLVVKWLSAPRLQHDIIKPKNQSVERE